MRDFRECTEQIWDQGKFLCAGFDPVIERIPENIKMVYGGNVEEIIFHFLKNIVTEISDLVGAFKPDIAFFEKYNLAGLRALDRICKFVRTTVPEAVLILDSKRGDIGKSNNGYVEFAFDFCDADAVTVQPYFGGISLDPFIEREHKGIFVVCRSSNKGSAEFQNLSVRPSLDDAKAWGIAIQSNEPEQRLKRDGGWKAPRMSLYEYVAYRVANVWNGHGNCGLVVGATYPDDIRKVRKAAPKLPLLIPGVGHQGDDLDASVRNAMDNHNAGFFINVSGSLIYASSGPDFSEAARREAQRMNVLISSIRHSEMSKRAD